MSDGSNTRPLLILLPGLDGSGRLFAPLLRARFRAVLAVDVRKEAAAIEVPVLALRATRDLVVRPSAGRELLRCMPRATSLELDAPHLLLQIASHAVAAELRRFITDPVGFGMRQTPIVPH